MLNVEMLIAKPEVSSSPWGLAVVIGVINQDNFVEINS